MFDKKRITFNSEVALPIGTEIKKDDGLYEVVENRQVVAVTIERYQNHTPRNRKIRKRKQECKKCKKYYRCLKLHNALVHK